MKSALSVKPVSSIRPKSCFKPLTIKIRAELKARRKNVPHRTSGIRTQENTDPRGQGLGDKGVDQVQPPVSQKNSSISKV